MKKILSLVLFLTFTASMTFAQADKKVKTKTPVKAAQRVADTPAPTGNESTISDGPVMNFEKTEVDYGVIEQGSDPLRVFHFTNNGTAPLIIKHAKGSCGCTVPKYPKEPILPGESNVIEVRYDTKRIGKFTKRVTLTTNEGNPTKVLTIKGETYKKKAEPAGVPETTPSILAPAAGGN